MALTLLTPLAICMYMCMDPIAYARVPTYM